jgi:translation initiation factor IF-3
MRPNGFNDRRPPVNPNQDENLVQSIHRLTQQVRVIDSRDEVDAALRNRVVSRDEAGRLREESGLDLYIVNKDTNPMVVKLVDYGKFRFEQKKAEKEAARKQRQNARTEKEFFFSPNMGEHDIQVRMKQIRDSIDDHDIKIAVRLSKHHKIILTNRFVKPLAQVIRADDFVLNRVIRDLAAISAPTKLELGENVVFAKLKRQAR